MATVFDPTKLLESVLPSQKGAYLHHGMYQAINSDKISKMKIYCKTKVYSNEP